MGPSGGGECLMVMPEDLEHQRLAHFSHIRLPGGETAVKEPWRIAQAALWEIGITAPGDYRWPWLDDFAQESRFLPQLLEKDINSPKTSSCGRCSMPWPHYADWQTPFLMRASSYPTGKGAGHARN